MEIRLEGLQRQACDMTNKPLGMEPVHCRVGDLVM